MQVSFPEKTAASFITKLWLGSTATTWAASAKPRGRWLQGTPMPRACSTATTRLSSRRALAKLAAGELLEVRGDSPELAEELAAWCRKEGHRYLGKDQGPNTYRIERSAGLAPLMASGSDIAEFADPHWGLAPRGARIE